MRNGGGSNAEPAESKCSLIAAAKFRRRVVNVEHLYTSEMHFTSLFSLSQKGTHTQKKQKTFTCPHSLLFLESDSSARSPCDPAEACPR